MGIIAVQKCATGLRHHLSTFQVLCHNGRDGISTSLSLSTASTARIRERFMTQDPTEEYRALRATIQVRGTARVWLFFVGLTVWGALVIATAALASVPVAVLVPLLVLAAAFEAIFVLH